MNHRMEQLYRFLEITPDDPFLYHALALEYEKLGEESMAESYFLQNLNQHPEYLPTYYHLGKFYIETQKEERAKPLLEKGMDLSKRDGDGHSFRELKSLWEETFYE